MSLFKFFRKKQPEESEKSEKFCVDCKWSYKTENYIDLQCLAPQAYNRVDQVMGVSVREYRLCSSHRNDITDTCTEKGLWFEKKNLKADLNMNIVKFLHQIVKSGFSLPSISCSEEQIFIEWQKDLHKLLIVCFKKNANQYIYTYMLGEKKLIDSVSFCFSHVEALPSDLTIYLKLFVDQ